jgi:sugar phosphate permease
MGLQQDTSITGDQFSLLAIVFYVTYLAFEFPTGYLMQRLPTAKYLGANVILWGLMVAITSAAKNWAALVTLRVLLGCFESAVAPALILITSMWYKKSEQPARVGFWYVGTGTGTIIGALTSFGFQFYMGDNFTSWQIMFLLFGLITIAVGILVVIFMPDSPMTSKLSREEKIWAIERLRENQTGIENKHFKIYQALECFKDPQTWLLSLITICSNVPNGAVSSYQATIIKGFGYTSKESALLSIPSGAIACIAVISSGVTASKYNVRGPIIMVVLLIGGVLGGSLLAFSPSTSKGSLLAGQYLTNVRTL